MLGTIICVWDDSCSDTEGTASLARASASPTAGCGTPAQLAGAPGTSRLRGRLGRQALVVTSILSSFGSVFKCILFGKRFDLHGRCKTIRGCSIWSIFIYSD